VLVLVFLDPSLRTRSSFEVAMARHGGHAFVVEPRRGGWPVEVEGGAGMGGHRTPHPVGTGPGVGRLGRGVGAALVPGRRASGGGGGEEVRRAGVAGGSATRRERRAGTLEPPGGPPCQERADARPLLGRLGGPRGKRLRLAWVWQRRARPTAVPASAALAAA